MPGTGRSWRMPETIRRLVFALVCGAAATQDAAALMPMPLLDTVWAWYSTTRADGAGTPVSSPERYTLQLLPNGSARVRADCNRGSAAYTSNDVDLRLDRIAMTKRGCPAGSRGSEFVADLASIRRYRFEGIDLLAVTDGATLRFRPLAP